MPRPHPQRALAGLALAAVCLLAGADGPAAPLTWDGVARQAETWGRRGLALYRRTPPAERVTWGGLIACALLASATAAERLTVVRRRRIVPRAFETKFRSRLVEGRLDRGKAQDYCELNPSPAARVAMAAVQRWGKPAADIERAAGLARRREVDALRRNVGTLRRVAALAPLIGLLGTLTAAGRSLSGLGRGAATAWGPALASALGPLTAGVALAILALATYDALAGRVESLDADLDRLGGEAADAIALAAPIEAPRPSPRADAAEARRAPHPSRTVSHEIEVDD